MSVDSWGNTSVLSFLFHVEYFYDSEKYSQICATFHDPSDNGSANDFRYGETIVCKRTHIKNSNNNNKKHLYIEEEKKMV